MAGLETQNDRHRPALLYRPIGTDLPAAPRSFNPPPSSPTPSPTPTPVRRTKKPTSCTTAAACRKPRMQRIGPVLMEAKIPSRAHGTGGAQRSRIRTGEGHTALTVKESSPSCAANQLTELVHPAPRLHLSGKAPERMTAWQINAQPAQDRCPASGANDPAGPGTAMITRPEGPRSHLRRGRVTGPSGHGGRHDQRPQPRDQDQPTGGRSNIVQAIRTSNALSADHTPTDWI